MNDEPIKNKGLVMSCPIPMDDYPYILLAHGGGGKLSHQLIKKMFIPTFSPGSSENQHDAAVLNCTSSKIAFTTDSYVVDPLFFPGGDIGMLAVNGTVNDLAMSGAQPLYLSVGFILEEGFPVNLLWRISQSIKEAAKEAGVEIVTGDTKVVNKGKGDGIFINTAGIGVIDHHQEIGPQRIETDDVIILNGDVARHGIAIMAVREDLKIESSIESDSAPLIYLVQELLSEGIEIHCMRDLTRGGLASALNEIAKSAQKGIIIDESIIPVREDVAAVCELLGFDAFYVANEGRFVAFVPDKDGEKALQIMKSHQLGQKACIIGKVVDEPSPKVTIKSKIGTKRILDMLTGEQLPRIC